MRKETFGVLFFACLLCATVNLDRVRYAVSQDVAPRFAGQEGTQLEVIEGDAAGVVSAVSQRVGVSIQYNEAHLSGKSLRVEYEKESPARALSALARELEENDLVLLHKDETMRIARFARVPVESRVLTVSVAEGDVEVVAGDSAQTVARGKRVQVYSDGSPSVPAQVNPEEVAEWRKKAADVRPLEGLSAIVDAPLQIRLVGTTSDHNLPIIECGVTETQHSIMLGSKQVQAKVLEVTPRNVVIDEEKGEMQIVLHLRINVR